MTQSQLDRAVAAATGETLSTIRRRGFSVAETPSIKTFDAPREPQIVDWDALDADRIRLLPHRNKALRKLRSYVSMDTES